MALSIFEKQVLTEFAENYLKEFKRVIDASASASGDLANSGEYEIAGNELVILANSYLYFSIYGRKPYTITNKNGKVVADPKKLPPISNIEKWLKDKGLVNLSPWAVAQSITKNGSKIWQQYQGQPSPLLDGIPLDALLATLQEGLGQRFVEQATTEFIKDFELEQLNIEL